MGPPEEESLREGRRRVSEEPGCAPSYLLSRKLNSGRAGRTNSRGAGGGRDADNGELIEGTEVTVLYVFVSSVIFVDIPVPGTSPLALDKYIVAFPLTRQFPDQSPTRHSPSSSLFTSILPISLWPRTRVKILSRLWPAAFQHLCMFRRISARVMHAETGILLSVSKWQKMRRAPGEGSRLNNIGSRAWGDQGGTAKLGGG